MIQLGIHNVVQYAHEFGIISPSDDIRRVEVRVADNFVAEVALSDGRSLFFKQGKGKRDGDRQEPLPFDDRIQRETRFYKLVGEEPALGRLRTILPGVLFSDAENRILVTIGFTNSQDLMSRAVEARRVQSAAARLLGRTVAEIHSETRGARGSALWEDLTSRPTLYDPLSAISSLLHELTPERMTDLPQESERLISALQRIPGLEGSVGIVSSRWSTNCLIHGDLRLVNIIHSPLHTPGMDPLLILDWEHCHPGDPVRDIGSVVGDFLGLWLFSIRVHPKSPPSSWFQHADFSFRSARHAIQMFWSAYCKQICENRPDPGNVIRFAGLFLISRAISHVRENGMILPNALIAAEVGGRLATEPEWALPRILGKEFAPL